jgi:hypothetical protein
MRVTMNRLLVPLAASLACGTTTTQTTPAEPPRLVGVLAVDSGGTQPEVLLWSGYTTDPETNQPPQTAPAFPAGYRGIRVEFDQLLDATSAAADLALGPRAGTNLSYSYCPPLADAQGGPSVRLFDGTREIGLSVCYVPDALIGTRPSLIVTIGANAIDAAQQPFTCKDFAPAPPAGGAGIAASDVLGPGKQYRLKIAGANLRGKNGKSLSLPLGSSTGGTWDGAGNFTFTASNFEPMAAGYTDSATSFNYFPRKFYSGYQKNKFEEKSRPVPADRTAIFLPLTAAVDGTSLKVTKPAAAGTVTVRRSDNSILGDVSVGLKGGRSADPKQIEVTPAATWEPNQTYTVTLETGIKARDGSALATASSASFSTADAPTTPFSVAPADGSLGNVALNFEAGSSKLTPSVVYTYPIDPATVTSANVQLTGPSGPVAGTPGLASGANNQRLTFVSAQRLKAATTYTLSVNNLTSRSAVSNLDGKPLGPSTSRFTTANFHGLRVGVKRTANATDTFSGAASTALMKVLFDGNLRVVFNDLAVNVVGSGNSNLDTLKVLEGTGPTATPIPAANVQITPDANYLPNDPPTGAYSAYVVKLAGYTPKLGTSYQIRLTSGIKDTSGNPVTAEGCAAPADCSDVVGFNTTPFGPDPVRRLRIDDTNLGAVKFTVKFNAPFDPASINKVMADWASGAVGVAGFHLYKVDPASGALQEVVDGSGKPALSCAAVTGAADSIACTTTSALSANTPYLFSATFTADSPARISTSFGVDPNAPAPPQPGPAYLGVISSSSYVSRCGP